MSAPKALPSSAPPPPQPAYILRGHAAEIHAVTFLAHNTLILTADASGVCILWTLSTRRPLAVWAAHNASILAVREWPPNRIITHGRDNKIYAWKLPSASDGLSTTLPVDASSPAEIASWKCPWLIASLEVNALNFCGFGFLDGLVAVPSVLETSAVDIFTLPEARRMHTRVASRETTGMAMALELRRLVPGVESELALIAGYESGHVVVLCNHGEKQWDTAYVLKPHSQPILSLAVYPDNSSFLTTSADSLIVRHPLGEGRVKVVDTRHLGLQGVSVRSDGKVFATAGWDGRFRVFSGKGMKELAVLKWHGVGCYAVAFAEILEEEGEGEVVDGGSSCDSALSGPREARPDGELARLSVTDSRIRRESRRHWIAGGAKDGKVSLWEIY